MSERVKGYADQSDETISLVNEFKADEERLLRKFDELAMTDGPVPYRGSDGRYYKSLVTEELWAADPMLLGQARVALTISFMLLNRAVFQPKRIELPEDTETKANG
jgi:hypothetical protein